MIRRAGVGSRLSTVDAGFRIRYEFTRKLVPYIHIVRERVSGETAHFRNAPKAARPTTPISSSACAPDFKKHRGSTNMAFVTRKTLLTLVVLAVVAVAAIAGFIWSGFYNVAANDPHTAPVYSLLETMRERSIKTRASKLEAPSDLMDRDRIIQGSGNYNAMCMGCHLAPGMDGTEMSRGLYPAPPNLSRATVDAAEAFWVIKHGIKASGMPAWGESMDDEYIWNMAAFLQELPKLNAAQYQAMIANSGGHTHGGGETEPHDDAPGTPEDHHDMPAAGSAAEPHLHPPGTPPHDDAPAETDAHAGMDHARPSTGAAENSASHDHPPGTPADHHAPARAKAPSTPAAKPTLKQDEPLPRPTPHDDGHDHQH